MTYAHDFHRLTRLETQLKRTTNAAERALLQVQVHTLTAAVSARLDAATGVPNSFFTLRNLQEKHDALVAS